MNSHDELTFLKRILSVTAFGENEGLWWRWRMGGSSPHDADDVLDMLADCSDLFWWGCADAERITPDNIDIFEQSYKDCPDLGGSLFCARVRKQRPQGVWFAKGSFDAEHMHWFEEFPEREVGLGNPYPWMSRADYEATKKVD